MVRMPGNSLKDISMYCSIHILSQYVRFVVCDDPMQKAHAPSAQYVCHCDISSQPLVAIPGSLSGRTHAGVEDDPISPWWRSSAPSGAFSGQFCSQCRISDSFADSFAYKKRYEVQKGNDPCTCAHAVASQL